MKMSPRIAKALILEGDAEHGRLAYLYPIAVAGRGPGVLLKGHFFAANGDARGISRAARGIAAGLEMQFTRAWRNW
jgi:hypothetical protein